MHKNGEKGKHFVIGVVVTWKGDTKQWVCALKCLYGFASGYDGVPSKWDANTREVELTCKTFDDGIADGANKARLFQASVLEGIRKIRHDANRQATLADLFGAYKEEDVIRYYEDVV